MVKRDSGTRSSRPPGPVGSLLTGNLRAYEEDRLGFLMDVRRYGSLASFDTRTTVVNDPHLALQILRDRDRLWDVSHDLLGRRLDQAESEDIVAVRPLLGPGMRASAWSVSPHTCFVSPMSGWRMCGTIRRSCWTR